MHNQEKRYAAGVDLGGTKIEVGIVDDSGEILDCCRLSTLVDEGVLAIETQIVDAINLLCEKHRLLISGVGIGVPGQVEAETGVVLFAPNLRWHHIPLKVELEKILRVPVFVVNDVRAITFGEWNYGAGRGYQDLLCVFIGTGIGGGVVSEGRLLTGYSNALGEVGHITIDYKGPICTCGKQGCFEAIAGGWGIARKAQDVVKAALDEGKGGAMLDLAGGDLKNIDARIVFEAFHANDLLAKQIVGEVERGLIAGLASLVNVYNPHRLILGGGVIDGMPELLPIIERGIRQIALKAVTESLEVVEGELRKDAGVVGAAAAAFHFLRSC